MTVGMATPLSTTYDGFPNRAAVIASEAKQSISREKEEWIASSLCSSQRRRTHLRTPATRIAPEFLFEPPSRSKRARGMPGAQCTRSLVCAGVVEYAHEYSQRRHRIHPAFPTQWFYGLYVLSPVTGLFCHRRPRDKPATLTPASGRQDHTTSPSASSVVRQRAAKASTASRTQRP